MSVIARIRSLLGIGDSGTDSTTTESGDSSMDAADSDAADPDTTDSGSEASGTPLDGNVQQQGELELTSDAFEDSGGMPDWTGYANENENPPLEIDGVPEEAESLVLIVDDPEAEPVVGHVWDHWLVWDIDPDQGEIPRDWDAEDATVGHNDYVENEWGGPAPPEGSHTYKFKLLALADELEAPPQARKSRLGSMIFTQTEILSATQLEGTYDAEQGTIF